MKIQLSDHFTAGRLVRFTLPSIVMMVFTSIYTVVDGLFVANFVGSNALASINIMMPMFLILGAFGFMLGSGGSAEVAKTMGEGREDDAKCYFTTLTIAVAVLGVLLTVGTIFFIRPLSYFMGASDLLIADCVTYGTICLIGNIPYMLQTFFQTFFITAEKPKLGMALTIASGVTNMVLDWLFIAVFQWGIAGAAIATSIGCAVGGFIPLLYFARKNTSRLHFVRPRLHWRMLLHSAGNGSSEMVSNASRALTTFLFNIQLMRLVGEAGVSAITIMQYVNFVFIAVMIGFSVGSAPVIGYHYGAQNHAELKGLFRICMTFIIAACLLMFVLSELVAGPLVTVFADSQSLYEMTLRGFRLFAVSFAVVGVNIFASAFFTALCNGAVSAFISFVRTIVFEAGAVMLLPIVLGLDGVWLALPVAEGLALLVSVLCFVIFRKRYQYA